MSTQMTKGDMRASRRYFIGELLDWFASAGKRVSLSTVKNIVRMAEADRILEYVKQYQNDDLCAKWNNNIPAEELDQDNYSWSHGYQLLVDSQHVDSLCEQFTFLPREDITGIIYTMGDGDYGEVYVTESSRPYDLQAIYHPLSYYVQE